MKSLEFALEKEEKLSRGPLTKLEFFVLENLLLQNLLLHCSECGIDVTAENVSQLYRVLLTSVKEVYPPLPLYNLPHEKLEGLHQKLSRPYVIYSSTIMPINKFVLISRHIRYMCVVLQLCYQHQYYLFAIRYFTLTPLGIYCTPLCILLYH